MTTYAIRFKDTERHKIKVLVDFMQSLDFVESVEKTGEFLENEPDIKKQPKGYLLKKEICHLYPNEWVLLSNAHLDGTEIIGGVVLLHHKDKRSLALSAKDILSQHPQTAHFFTGEIPQRATNGLARIARPL